MKYNEYLKSQHLSGEPFQNHCQGASQSRPKVQHQIPEPTSREVQQNRSMLSSWAVLSGIGATICEYRHLNLLSQAHITDLEADLVAWYRMRNCCTTEFCWNRKQSDLPFCLRPLWHYTFMTLAADIDLLEIAVGRDGTNISPSVLEHVRTWMSSPESKRCLLHALFLQNLLKSTTVDTTTAIHTPRIIFTAALCWYCFMLYLPWCAASLDTDSSSLLDEDTEYLLGLPEIQLLRDNVNTAGTTIVDSTISEFKRILGTNAADMKASTFCVLGSILRRLGTSGISQKFTDLIHVFITGGMQ